MVRRGVVQLLSALLHNANLPGFITGRIWQAQPKSVCVPVLNCYSCPGALGACPIGSLQSTLAGTALKFPFYVVGLLLLFALCLGRVICGWLCPFGLVQDLLYKIPSPKLRKNAFTQKLSLLKYAVASDNDTFLVVTESGILHEMQKQAPEKRFIPVPPDDSTCNCNECNFMRLITLQKLYNSLRYEWPTVHVSEDVAEAAIKPIQRMLDISAKLGL